MASPSAFALKSRRTKEEVCNAFLATLAERGDIDVDAPGFRHSIRQHFDSLPTRYALDVNTETLDVLSHKRLLDEARGDPSTVSFAVRPVEVILPRHRTAADANNNTAPLDSPSSPAPGEVGDWTVLGAVRQDTRSKQGGCSVGPCALVPPSTTRVRVLVLVLSRLQGRPNFFRRQASLPKPAFGSSPNLQVRVV